MPLNWRKLEAWRQHPMLTNNLRHSVPGLLYGSIAFALYVAYDQTMNSGKKSHH